MTAPTRAACAAGMASQTALASWRTDETFHETTEPDGATEERGHRSGHQRASRQHGRAEAQVRAVWEPRAGRRTGPLRRWVRGIQGPELAARAALLEPGRGGRGGAGARGREEPEADEYEQEPQADEEDDELEAEAYEQERGGRGGRRAGGRRESRTRRRTRRRSLRRPRRTRTSPTRTMTKAVRTRATTSRRRAGTNRLATRRRSPMPTMTPRSSRPRGAPGTRRRDELGKAHAASEAQAEAPGGAPEGRAAQPRAAAAAPAADASSPEVGDPKRRLDRVRRRGTLNCGNRLQPGWRKAHG